MRLIRLVGVSLIANGKKLKVDGVVATMVAIVVAANAAAFGLLAG